jgi:hypothetical protein
MPALDCSTLHSAILVMHIVCAHTTEQLCSLQLCSLQLCLWTRKG